MSWQVVVSPPESVMEKLAHLFHLKSVEKVRDAQFESFGRALLGV